MKIRYYIEPRGRASAAAAVFLLLAVGLRLVWGALFPEELRGAALLTQGLLPLLSCLGLILCLRRWGRDAFHLTFFPVLGGVIFFIVKATGFVWWHQALCTLLYLSVAALYGLTAFGVLPIRRLLIPLFGLPLAFHLFVEDLFINRTVYDLSGWLKEASVLCIMAALLSVALGIHEKSSGQ